jgi:thiol-disulfide isomerase/thioredoxin
MLAAALSLLLAQQTPPAPPSTPAPPPSFRVELAPKAPADGEALGWSPKGAKVELARAGDVLRGSFALGPAGGSGVTVELSKSDGSERYDRLAIDADRDGKLGDAERLTTKPSEQRGKWWSSFDATVQVPFGAGVVRQPYPMSLWFVADPQEPDAPPSLRWSRRGWHEGTFESGGKTVHVLITEMEMDGTFSRADSWQLGSDRKAMLKSGSRSLATHAWVDGRAFRATAIAADGSELVLEPFDPGITEAEEREQADKLKADRSAKRAAAPLVFGKDLAAALEQGQRDGKRVFVDFETTWCGPCKQMDQWVYTAADVVAAAGNVIAVKVDGDEHRDLVKQHGVKAYPTLLLLDEKGAEVQRAVGYQSVAAMVKFFAGPAK